MNLEAFKLFSDTNNWLVIAPEIWLALTALSLLVAELFVPRQRHRWIGFGALCSQLLLLGYLVVSFFYLNSPQGEYFSGMILLSERGEIFRIFFVLASAFVTCLGLIYLQKQVLPKVEFFAITLLISAGMMLLCLSNHMVMLFVALETVTVGFYILVSYCRNSPFSLEAGLKYLILGALSSAILLFGIVLLYGIAGSPELAGSSRDSMSFAGLEQFLSYNPNNLIALTGAVLVVAGIAFKLGAFPFQIWVPDVYQGAPTPVTAFLAVASKAAGVFVLINLLTGPFSVLKPLMTALLSCIAIITILFGNLTALSQRNVKRMMGLSGIAHAGYLLVGLVALIHGSDLAVMAMLFYLFAYLFASFGAFGVMSLVAGTNDESQELEHYEELAKTQPFLAAVLAISLGSLAGIPPLAGFIGKLLLFIAAFQAQLYLLLGVSIIGVVISIYYYFNWIREAYFHRNDLITSERDTAPISHAGLSVSKPVCAMLSVAIAGSLILGVYQVW